ncbi:MAG: choice-of-anchor J domain-containing protein, partial [Anaerolineae bacterium]|nr:choice-of-anchor J domain-containing protein [Anaerolineae bacterium]
LADASVVETTVCPGDDTYRPMTAVIDPQAGYVYFGLHTPPTGSVIRMSLYQEGGAYRVYLPIVAREYGGVLPLTEGFERGVVPPAGWTRIQTNPRDTWAISTDPYSGTYSAQVSKDWDEELQDELLLTPYFETSSAGLQFYSKGNLAWCRDLKDNCDLNIWLVVGDWGGDDDIFLGQADDDWPSSGWGLTSIDLTPHLPADTPVRVAFQYYGQDGAWIKIDQISITDSNE